MTSNNETVFLTEHSHWLLRSHMTTNNETFYITALYHWLLWSHMKGFTHHKVKEKRKWHKKLVSSTCWVDTKEKKDTEKRTTATESLQLRWPIYYLQFDDREFLFHSPTDAKPQCLQLHSLFCKTHVTNSSKLTFCCCCHQVPNLEHISHSPFWISAKKKKKQRKNTDSERLLKNKETLIFIYDPSAANSEWNTMTVTWTCLESLRNHHVCQQGDKSTTTRTTKRDKQKQTKTNNYKQVTDVLLRWSWRT